MNSTNRNTPMPPRTSAIDPESRITSALEHKPDLEIPTGFATKVAALAAAQPLSHRRHKPEFGKLMALLSVPIVATALFVLAPHAAPNLKSLSFDAEVTLLAELAFIGWWISRSFKIRVSR